jgi:hypothetical protein
MNPFKRRAGAVFATLAMVAGGAVGGVALAGVTAGVAQAAMPTKVTFNDNGCTNNIQTNNPALIAMGVGADQTYAGLANTVDPATGATVPGSGNVTVSAAGASGAGLTPTASVLQGGSGSLTNFGGHGFVSAAFLQAGVNLHVISVGQSINATLSMTIDATNATFTGSGTSRITVSGPGSGTVPGSGSTVSGPLDAAIQFPDTPFTVPNTPGVNAYFYQDSTSIGTGAPGNGDGEAVNASAQLVAALGALGNANIGCMPGEVSTATPPVYTQSAQGSIHVFAAVAVSPAQPPVLVSPQSGTVNLGASVVIHALAGATDNVAINPASGAVVTAPAHGTVAFNSATGDITYTETDLAGPPASDTFSYTFSSAGGKSNVATANISIVAHPSSCDVTAQPTCTLDQTVLVPVTGADLVMAQNSGQPVDLLNHTLSGTNCTGPAITLNGQPQFACGAMFPVTVVNARGTDPGWTLSGQVSDFLDPAAPSTLTCDTPATYNNHCIPGGNMSWLPAAAVAHGIIPGDTAQVTAGAAVLALNVIAPNVANAPQAIAAFAAVPGQSTATQANPVVEPAPQAGLHNVAQTLCSTAANQSGGTFICGAGLVVGVPASAAAPAAPGYEATLTLTLV